MSKTSNMARYKQLKEWWFVFNRNRKYKPKKKKAFTPTTQYYVNAEGNVIVVENED